MWSFGVPFESGGLEAGRQQCLCCKLPEVKKQGSLTVYQAKRKAAMWFSKEALFPARGPGTGSNAGGTKKTQAPMC